MAHIAHANIRLRRQRVEIGEIRDVRHLNNGNVDITPIGTQVFAFLQRHAILIFRSTSSQGITPRTGTPVSASICSMPE
ncbi:Uncharacterised protein [Citrobacter koseri]|uniref:Uncharacterized protein n=1 Tax=Citrobacter koseri TaxID=545 RepID=A0A447UHG9_CITKO|nr:Uncharacterised protein [Citrobacter koseri]